MHYSIFYHCGSIDSLSVETQEGTFYQAKGLLDAFYSIVLSVSNIFKHRLHVCTWAWRRPRWSTDRAASGWAAPWSWADPGRSHLQSPYHSVTNGTCSSWYTLLADNLCITYSSFGWWGHLKIAMKQSKSIFISRHSHKYKVFQNQKKDSVQLLFWFYTRSTIEHH